MLGLFVLMATVGCETQPTVIRVQRAIEKDVLENSEWYFLQTVIDTPYSAPYTFVGEQGSTEKIIWEIQEHLLIARRSYSHIAGSEPEGIAGDTETGAVVAMYEIEKHFDIRREYNPVTGEEQNVLIEDDRDRLWHQRDFMRVDWSTNLVTNNDFLVAAKLFDGIRTEAVSYFIEPNTDHPHEAKFVRETPEGPVHYIDIVNKMFVEPTTAFLEGFGEIPTCFLLSQGHLDCAPGEITVRNSFLRVDPSRDYEPMEYTGDRQDRFGYFVTERAGYDERYGVVEPSRFRFADRHNLWRASHRRTESGELIDCRSDMECGGGGSVCDIALAFAERSQDDDGQWVGACTIPYREREVRPIAYHLSSNFPEDLIPDAEDVGRHWNRAFVETVASLRENECLSAGGSDCGAERLRGDHQQMFVICHNPVQADDHDACGVEGTVAEIGDLRYSMLGWVNEPHSSSPLGYGPSSADPETGEIIMGNAFIYGAGLETLQAFARDILALLNGDVREEDITSGEVVDAWVRENRELRSLTSGRPADDHVTSIDGFNVDRSADAMDFAWVRNFRGAPDALPSSPADFIARFEHSRQQLLRAGAFGDGAERGQARLQSLVGTDIERLLTGPEMRLAAGIDPNFDTDSPGIIEQASPLQGMSPRRLNVVERAQAAMHTQGHCLLHADFADEGLLGLARAVQRAVEAGDGTMEWYGRTYQLREEDGTIDYEAVLQMVRHPIFHGVTAHEIGHTIGLRHNFSGSHDALNYHPRYWELRDDGDMRPRAWDPLSEAEIDGRIREYEYSTVMDYGNNFVVTDAQGIGHYDMAAVKMGYGDLVEVFADPVPDSEELAWYAFFNANWPVPLRISAFTGGEVSAYNYTDIPGLVGGLGALEARVDVPYGSLEAHPALARQGVDELMVDGEGRMAVPFEFCSDEQADLGPDCYRYDAGADPYETVTSVIDNYWNYYIFNAFRRGRIGFGTESYSQRIWSRYLRKLKYANQIYSLNRAVFEDIFGDNPSLDSFWTRQDGFGPYTAAVGSSLELLTRIVTTPEPGVYNETPRGDGSVAFLPGGGIFGDLAVDDFEGRALETTWNFDDGYFWFDQLERAGFYYDKILALQTLVDPESNFLGRDTAADVRRYQINFYSSFGPAVTGFFRGLMGEDWDAIGPRQVERDLSFPDPLNLAGEPMRGVPIDPNASFSIQLNAATYAMAQIPDTFDRTFFQRTRVWVIGGPEAITPDPSISTVEFTDPATGLVYVAASYPSEDGIETGPAAQMIQHAQALADNGATGELARYIDNLNVVRRLSWLYDFGS
ncbi:MAG: zinc-dependent metalloprotease [Myxococcota bacterium]